MYEHRSAFVVVSLRLWPAALGVPLDERFECRSYMDRCVICAAQYIYNIYIPLVIGMLGALARRTLCCAMEKPDPRLMDLLLIRYRWYYVCVWLCI